MGKNLKGKELGKGFSQRPDGKYNARATINGVRICLYDTNLNSLKMSFYKAKQDVEKNMDIRSSKITLGEWFSEWFEVYKAPSIKPTSVNTTKNRVTANFIRAFEYKKIRDITNLDIQRQIDALSKSGKTNATIRSALSTFKECMASAQNNRLIQSNPCFDIKVPWEYKRIQTARYLTLEEQRIFLNACKEHPFEEMFYIMFYTGLRIGEVGGLKWCDIDWKNKCINIKRQLSIQYYDHKKDMKFTQVKTANSERTIPFMAEVEQKLKSWKKKQDTLKQQLGEHYRSQGEFRDLVFTTTMGSPMVRHVAEKAINAIVKEINLNENVQSVLENREPNEFEHMYPHSIRHSFCCRCFEQGMNPKVVQALLGHADLSMTMNVYLHVSPEIIKEEANKLAVLEENYANFSNVHTQVFSKQNFA